jgi:uncharacterized membrane-anchored protein
MFYGAGFAVLAACGLSVELDISRRDAYVTALGLGVLLVLIGVLGLFAVVPAWYFLGAVPTLCVQTSYRASYSSFIIGATGNVSLFVIVFLKFSIVVESVNLSIECFAFCLIGIS